VARPEGKETSKAKVHKAAYEKVCGRPGVPIIFPTWWEAEIAAWRALRAHIRGEMLRWGDPISLAARAEAEKLFSTSDIFKRGKRIQVIRK
jgi:hypothetical protein